MNEKPTAIKLSGSGTITSDAQTGQVIGTLRVIDPDSNQKYIFMVTGPFSTLVKVGVFQVVNYPLLLKNLKYCKNSANLASFCKPCLIP